jgi:23S rRNA pseudouridine1911/1915/1917 synthase
VGDPDPTPDPLDDDEDPPLLVWRVASDQAGRLDAFVGEALRAQGHSRSQIQGWIDSGRVRVHRGDETPKAKRSLKLKPGDEVLVQPPPPPPPPEPLQPEDLPLTILHQDDAILVLDKPPGMAVHPGAGVRRGTLAGALLHASAGRLSTVGGPERPGIVHRLDKDTTGVIVVARTDAAHRDLARQFHDRVVRKRYLALVEGRPPADEGLIDKPLGRHPKDRKRMAVVDGGRPSRTGYVVQERFGKRHALILAKPETGRTHQIRVHLKSIGCPILADATYGREGFRRQDAGLPGDPDELLLTRQALHAFQLSFDHPSSGARLTFEAPLPADMQATLEALRAL